VIYDLKLRITYDYANSAVGGRHVICLRPIDLGPVQHVISARLDVDPAPEEWLERRDFFDNHVAEFSFRGPHDHMAVALNARVKRLPQPANLPASALMRNLPELLADWRDIGPQSPLHFLSPSTRVPLQAEMTAFAKAAIKPRMTVAEAVRAVGKSLHRHMRFDSKATTVDTPAAEAFAQRRGVCQDFSHIMIACLRGIGVPSGYVSGFLRTLPPPGKPRLEGADAMHAWVRAWAGAGLGWIEFDPTNDMEAGTDHIVVAYGRDYSDVVPIKGTMRTSGRQKSHQAVDVIPVKDPSIALSSPSPV
jgi:transglutaminase-like putative cysteine protease